MRKDFYLFRHGETAYNLEGRWQGRSVDLPLDATGLAQAETLAKNLVKTGLEVVYSSPLARARQTAQAVAAAAGVEVRILPELTEGDLGVCEGMFTTDIAAQYPELWHKWYDETTATDTRWPSGESKLEMQQRMFRGFEKMLSAPENIIGAASHSGSMRYFLLAFGYGPHKIPNTAVFHLVYDGSWHLSEIFGNTDKRR